MDYMVPRQGERLTWDGRRFLLTGVRAPDALCRTMWWTAVALDGQTQLQGNVRLRRRGLSDGWEPA